jgi:predicted transcriptional regulator of viral defense system
MARMGPQTTPDQRLAEIARVQHGVVSRRQLAEMGFGERAIARRIAARRLHRLYRGVYAVGHTVVDWRGRYLAAVLACGDSAVLSHRSAADLWGMRPTATARIDVTVPRTSGVRSQGRIVVHRPRRSAETVTREGIPVTTPGRTLADLATALPRRDLEKAAEMAEAQKLHVAFDPDHPGAKRLAEILDGHDLGTDTRSGLEDDFLALCDRYAIPRPRVNTLVEGFLVDFCWPEERLIVETDGRHHLTRAAFERDRARDAFLTAIGWRVMRFTRRQVRGEPETVAARVISARSPLLVTP